jgi:ubiquinone/menaquinone biosynthesis C-methylase UbiE
LNHPANLPLEQRLNALWDHLGVAAAHVATQVPADIAAFAAAWPSRIASLMLCTPVRLDPTPFAPVADRTLLIAGSRGLSAEVTARAQARLPGSQRVEFADYDAPGWADVARDRGPDIVAALRQSAMRAPADTPGQTERSGIHAGLTYTMAGAGPTLVLLPFFLAPSQWEPIADELAQNFTVVTVGGRHVGGVAALEDRARSDSYRAMAGALFDAIAPRAGESILDVGCGSGALDRMLAYRLNGANRIVATDLNPFLLREAAVLAAEDGVQALIDFQPANAETLPFPDNAFDCAFTITVLEECDADKALRELLRVLRPGGRVGVVVRSIDLAQWWHLDLPETLRRKVEIPPQSVAAKGVADASLYRRMRAAGFDNLRCFPTLVTFDRPDGPIWRYREDHVLSQLNAEETAIWRAACDAARRDGLLFMANPLHCAVGTKPN